MCHGGEVGCFLLALFALCFVDTSFHFVVCGGKIL